MKTMLGIRIDRTKRLAEDPDTGHNRWHPDIPPVIRCDLGDEVILEAPGCVRRTDGP
jgi:formamidase